jgi:predicted transcriptional regulator
MNQLKVNQRLTIASLHEQGWSKRKIARELALDRATVRKYLAGSTSKSPTPHTGSITLPESKSPTHPHIGSPVHPGPASVCDPWEEPIDKAWQAGLSVQRIYQDLVAEHQFPGSYHAVRRFVRRRHGKAAELPFRRMEVAPGQ